MGSPTLSVPRTPEALMAWRDAHLRFKVLRCPGLTSVGLLHSNIISYNRARWNVPAEPPQEGRQGPGGLWVNRRLSQARSAAKYLWNKYQMRTVIYACVIDERLFESSYRTKTNRLFLLYRIH